MEPIVTAHVYEPPEEGLLDIPFVAYVELPDGNVVFGTFRDRDEAFRFIEYVTIAELRQGPPPLPGGQ